MKQRITQVLVCLLVVILLLTGVSVIQIQTGISSMTAQAATKQTSTTKPVISSTQTTIRSNTCTVATGKKVKLTAKSGKTTVTKKGTWKSSKTAVATIGKNTGILTAKKAGTTYITVAYNGKTSAKLKVVVKKAASSEAYTITFNKNSTDSSDKLSGSSKQVVSGEILKFSATVTSKNKNFIGWYTKKTGGTRIYETYTPTKDMTLYAHYTDKKVQRVTFSLGCSYENKYTDDKVSFMGYYVPPIDNSFEYPSMKLDRGPMNYDDPNNLCWNHSYEVADKTSFTIDTLPKPNIPGYTFQGWYTSNQAFSEEMNKGIKVENGQPLDTDITMLYARFSKKLTISFDDLHGGQYDDIVIDTYTPIKESGYRFPNPNIPGVNFKGWAVSSKPDEPGYILIGENFVFRNVIFNYGYECHHIKSLDSDICSALCRDLRAFDLHKGIMHNGSAAWTNLEVYEETDHVTLYPVYTYNNVIFEFDPNGGKFVKNTEENQYLTLYESNEKNFKQGFGYLTNLISDAFYGVTTKYTPGHENEPGWFWSAQGAKIPKVMKSNYEFDGWILPNGETLTDETLVTENATLTAKWIPGICRPMFEPGDGYFTSAELASTGLDRSYRYNITTESTIAKDGKRLPVPVSSKGRKFEGWFTEDGKPFDENTQIFSDIVLYAHWSLSPNS